MKLPRPGLRFSLRAILLVVAAMACFLGWRLWDFESSAVAAIERAGGTVYYHYQNPSISNVLISVAMLPDFEYLDIVQVTASPKAEPPLPTLRELLEGTYTAKHVATVDIPLDKLTPEMVAEVRSLPDLRVVVVRVTGGVMLRRDSPEAKRLEELRESFQGKLHATYAIP